MKILYNLAGTFNSGGMERIVISKANALNEAGFRVFIVTTEQQGRKPYFKIDDRIECIDLGINYSRDNGRLLHKLLHFPFRQRKHLCMLRKVIDEIDPDIIISTFGNEVRLLPKLKTDAKKVLEIHFSKYFRLQENRKGLWHYIDTYRTIQDKRTISHYDKFVVLTHEDKNLWGNISNIAVIPNFIDLVSTVAAPLENNRCVAVGRLTYQKGFDLLINAWKIVHEKHSDWHLDIYGSGESEKYLMANILKYHLENSITINQPIKDISKAYYDSSIFLFTSRYEGFGLALIEALSCGLPAVSFDCKCGPKDIIEDGKNGFLVKTGDIQNFSDRIITLIEDYELRKDMGKLAKESSHKYSREAIIQMWISLFNSLVNNN